MGDSSARDRDRSRSPSRRHRDRSRERESSSRSHKHSSSRRDSHDDRDRERSHRRHRAHDREETEEERKERKRAKKEKERRRDDRREDGKRSSRRDAGDHDEEGMWVEKGVDTEMAVSDIPTADDLALTSHVSQSTSAKLPPDVSAESKPRERDAWMLDPGVMDGGSRPAPVLRDAPRSAGLSSARSGIDRDSQDLYAAQSSSARGENEDDLFSAMGTEHKRKDPNADKPDVSKLQIHGNELNKQLLMGKALDDYEVKEKKTTAPGGPGYQWRMMKLRRLYEQAEEQGREVQEVALERYGSMEEFEEALAERRFLDDREQRKNLRRGNTSGSEGVGSPASSGMRTPGGGPDGSGRRYMFTSDEAMSSRPSSRAGFRRPGEAPEGAQTPGGSAGAARVDALRRQESGIGGSAIKGTPNPPKVSTPIPSVFTPTHLARSHSGYPFDTPTAAGQQAAGSGNADPTSSQPPLSLEQLNKLQATVLRAKLMDDENAAELEDEYERERFRAESASAGQGGLWAGSGSGAQGQFGRIEEDGTRVEVQVLPTLDGRGKLYDVGQGAEDEQKVLPGNRRKKQEKFETRDKQGNLLRYNKDDDEVTLGELVRQERFGAGAGDQKNLDAEMAANIATDARFDDNLDYMDDNADRIARKKMKSDAMKRAFAINDYARTKRALDTCPFCYQDDRNPLTAIVALGTRTYMCCTTVEELVPGHCFIVPLQHCLSTLEMEDDDWDEVRNFMKCLMRMFAKENKGVIFFETCLSFRQQRHTYIEAIPVPFDQFQDLPAYFRESILASESEWSQHKKVIDFSARPGGFRRAMVSNLPYFMVQWDYKGEKGYGHVIEGVDDAAGRGQGEDDMGGAVDEGEKGGGAFPPYFAQEIIGNLLGLEPRKWLRPRRMDYALNQERARALGARFQPYNWTVQLQQQPQQA